MAGDAELLDVDLFCDGEAEVVPLGVALLTMRRYGVMDLRLYAIVAKILLECITLLAKNGEDMPDGVRDITGKDDARVLHLIYIYRGYFPAAQVVGIEMPQFHAEHGGLQLVDARVAPLIVVYIFLMTAVIAQGTDDVCKLVVAGGDGSCIAEGPEVLARIETVASGIAETSRLSPLEATAVSLSIVLDELQPVLSAEVANP